MTRPDQNDEQPTGPVSWSRDELLRRLTSAVGGASGIAYAIGGATAMALHGYKRETQDVDVFVLDRDLNRFMVALRGAGLEVYAIAEASHFAARLPGDPEPERRINVLVPFSEPELSAAEFPVEVETGSGKLRYMSPPLLAMVKFYAFDDSGDLRHAADLQAMYRRGVYDADHVRTMILSVDPERVEAFDRLVASFTSRGRRNGRPQARLPEEHLPPDENGSAE